MDSSQAAVMRVLCEQHTAALWRFAMLLTGDRGRAADVINETLRRAGQHPEIADYSDGSARAWLFTVARDIIDERGAT
jgi:RNA polymerase sigma-70 factor (ECF subfamily)